MDMVAGMLTTSLDLVALAAVVLIGLPHGALDGATRILAMRPR